MADQHATPETESEVQPPAPAAVAVTQPAPAAPPRPTNGATSGDDNLDALLSEFEAATNKPEAAPEAEPAAERRASDMPQAPESQELLTLLNWASSVEADRRVQRDSSDTRSAVNHIRGELPSETYPDAMIAGWLMEQSSSNPALQKVWEGRYADPKQYQRAVERLGRDFNQRFSNLPDKQLTEEREAVSAAVRGASSRAPEGRPVSYGDMSDADFREDVKKKHGFTPI